MAKQPVSQTRGVVAIEERPSPVQQRQIIQLTTDIVKFYRDITQNAHFNQSVGNSGKPNTLPNHGNYTAVCGEVLNQRYLVKGLIGSGSFGQVVQAVDLQSQQRVAIKVMRNLPAFYQIGCKEAEVLGLLNQMDTDHRCNIVRMLDRFVWRDHLCLALEYLSCTLRQLLHCTRYQGLSLYLIRRIGVQLLRSLALLGRARLVHCDIKPDNIMLVSIKQPRIKLIDFGCAHFYDHLASAYIQSRQYRSPEVLLGSGLGPESDMWGLGCTLAELFTGKVLFPGIDEVDQLLRIIEVCGLPSNHHVQSGMFREKFFAETGGNWEPRTHSNQVHNPPGSVPLQGILTLRDLDVNKEADVAQFVDLVSRMLIIDPARRISVVQAARHPFFSNHYALATTASTRLSPLVTPTGSSSNSSGGGGDPPCYPLAFRGLKVASSLLSLQPPQQAVVSMVTTVVNATTTALDLEPSCADQLPNPLAHRLLHEVSPPWGRPIARVLRFDHTTDGGGQEEGQHTAPSGRLFLCPQSDSGGGGSTDSRQSSTP